jgi:hypothetical protein
VPGVDEDGRSTDDLHVSLFADEGHYPNIHLINCNAYQLDKLDPVDAQVICIDPNYGLFPEDYEWDTQPISKHNLNILLSAIYTKSHGDHRVIIIWCTIDMSNDVEQCLLAAGQCKSVIRLVWSKVNTAMKHGNAGMFAYASEVICVGFSGSSGVDRLDQPRTPEGWIHFEKGESRSNVIEANVAKKRMQQVRDGVTEGTKVNRCQKPLWLCMKLLKLFSVPGDNVLDIFAGTGILRDVMLVLCLCYYVCNSICILLCYMLSGSKYLK